MVCNELKNTIQMKYDYIKNELDERSRRHWVAIEAKAIGWGGISVVSVSTGMSHSTIKRGLVEIERSMKTKSKNDRRIRNKGGGRKPLLYHDPTLLRDLDAMIDPTESGDPMPPLRWTCKSIRKLAEELNIQGHKIGRQKVDELLHRLDYSLQGNRKVKEGSSHPDRNAQFEYIYSQVKKFQKRNQPVISIDAKKKENIGDFKNDGQEWHPKGDPEQVRVYDFKDKELGKGIPYGVYDQTANNGWVSVGIDHDTAEFAGATILHWWIQGSKEYPDAKKLLITADESPTDESVGFILGARGPYRSAASFGSELPQDKAGICFPFSPATKRWRSPKGIPADGGGSNSSRSRLWKILLQKLADETNLIISVCHFPPGTSKWNKIEHRMFAFITKNWRGRPPVSHEVMVNLIRNTTTEKGLPIRAALDKDQYLVDRKIGDPELECVNIEKADIHGEWNYKIYPDDNIRNI